MKKRKKPHKSCKRDRALSLRTRPLCRQGVALASNRQIRLQGPVSVHAHRTEGVTGSEGRKGANGGGGETGVRGGNGDGNGVGDGDRARTKTGVEMNEGTQLRNGNESRDKAATGTVTGVEALGTGTGAGTETRAVVKMGTGTRMGTGTGTKTGPGRVEDRRRSARSRTKNVGTMWETGKTWVEREKRRQARAGSVAADPDNQEDSKESGGEAQGT